MNVVDSYDNKPPSKSAVRVELEAVIDVVIKTSVYNYMYHDFDTSCNDF